MGGDCFHVMAKKIPGRWRKNSGGFGEGKGVPVMVTLKLRMSRRNAKVQGKSLG